MNEEEMADTNLGVAKRVPPKALNIKRVVNGYIISGRYVEDEKQVAKLLNEMLDIVKDYFEEK